MRFEISLAPAPFEALSNSWPTSINRVRKGRIRRRATHITMVTVEGARAAIQALHGKQIAEHILIVTEVTPNLQRNGLSSSQRKPDRGYRGMAGLAKLSLKGKS